MIDRQRKGERRHANNNDASSRNRSTLPPCYTATAIYHRRIYISVCILHLRTSTPRIVRRLLHGEAYVGCWLNQNINNIIEILSGGIARLIGNA